MALTLTRQVCTHVKRYRSLIIVFNTEGTGTSRMYLNYQLQVSKITGIKISFSKKGHSK